MAYSSEILDCSARIMINLRCGPVRMINLRCGPH